MLGLVQSEIVRGQNTHDSGNYSYNGMLRETRWEFSLQESTISTGLPTSQITTPGVASDWDCKGPDRKKKPPR